MPLPNQFLVRVSDTAMAVAFYRELFGAEATMLSDRYAIFELGDGVVLALWSEKASELSRDGLPRFEIGILVDDDAQTRALHEEWVDKGVEIVEPPREDVFGLTFVAQDLDGNRIRVAPADH